MWKCGDIRLTVEQQKKAVANGIDRKTVYSRISGLNWDVEKAVTVPKQERGWRIRELFLNEDQVKTAKKNGLNYSNIHQRVDRGWSLDDALNLPIHSRSVKSEWVCGDITLTEEQVQKARENGLDYALVYDRIRLGLDAETAVTKPRRKKASNTVKEGHKAVVKYRKRDMIIGVYKTAEEAREAEKRAMEALT